MDSLSVFISKRNISCGINFSLSLCLCFSNSCSLLILDNLVLTLDFCKHLAKCFLCLFKSSIGWISLICFTSCFLLIKEIGHKFLDYALFNSFIKLLGQLTDLFCSQGITLFLQSCCSFFSFLLFLIEFWVSLFFCFSDCNKCIFKVLECRSNSNLFFLQKSFGSSIFFLLD